MHSGLDGDQARARVVSPPPAAVLKEQRRRRMLSAVERGKRVTKIIHVIDNFTHTRKISYTLYYHPVVLCAVKDLTMLNDTTSHSCFTKRFFFSQPKSTPHNTCPQPPLMVIFFSTATTQPNTAKYISRAIFWTCVMWRVPWNIGVFYEFYRLSIT
jgi:hypothetical protein